MNIPVNVCWKLISNRYFTIYRLENQIEDTGEGKQTNNKNKDDNPQ